MPRISIDLRMFCSSGIGTYLRNLVPLIVKGCSTAQFSLLGKTEEISGYDWGPSGKATLIDCRTPIYSAIEQLDLARKIPQDTALFWSPHYNIPLLYRGRLLVTVHDVFHLAMPQYTGGLHKQLYAKAMFAAIRYKAEAVLTVSEFTKSELLRLGGQQEQNIRAIHCGVDASWFRARRGPRPHNRPYLLYVGNVKPHKNLATLVQAFKSIKDRIPQDLLIVGGTERLITKDETIAIAAADSGGRVHFTGYVEDDLLRRYFSYADALVWPSLYEGFGLPPLEAMACGCPVLVSNVASLPEVCGDAALYCDPYNAKDIADKILLLINNRSLRENLRGKGKKHAKRFTWDRCAEQTVDAIDRVLRTEITSRHPSTPSIKLGDRRGRN
jgi:glycosyltransferase involved in cell wall biosynthesis